MRIHYYTPDGQLLPPYQTIPLKNCFKVVCTNKINQKQSKFSRIIKGKIFYSNSINNDFWEKEMELRPKGSSKNVIRIINNPFNTLLNKIYKGQQTELVNPKKGKVIFEF